MQEGDDSLVLQTLSSYAETDLTKWNTPTSQKLALIINDVFV
jgi:hypothetical protein